MNCSRQSGKSTVAASLSVLVALLDAPALVLLVSRTKRQSSRLFKRVKEIYRLLGGPSESVRDTDDCLELGNGSEVICLPGQEENVRCYSSVDLLVIDEAARVPDELYEATRPMLAVSNGRLVCLSTPYGKRGFFHQEWESKENWVKVRIPASMCPRIKPSFLEEERRTRGDRYYNQEFCCSFEDCVDSVFAGDDIQAAMSDDVEPLFV
jgi:Terminase large subunit, T4likevirus-type, N-terminal